MSIKSDKLKYKMQLIVNSSELILNEALKSEYDS